MDITRYLARIGYGGPRTPSAQALRQLQRAHLFAVPFENLSIGWGEPIELSDVAAYWKIVECRRGGFCYEQNGLFAWALRELGYEVTLLGAQVYSNALDQPGFGLPMSHLTLRVDIDGPYLVDVGHGDCFLHPILMRIDTVHPEPFDRDFRITESDGFFTLEMRTGSGPFQPRYRFALTPRDIAEFAQMCEYHQTSPESPFTQRRVVTLAKPDGRSTLINRHFTETGVTGVVEDFELNTEQEVGALLFERFGMIAPGFRPDANNASRAARFGVHSGTPLL